MRRADAVTHGIHISRRAAAPASPGGSTIPSSIRVGAIAPTSAVSGPAPAIQRLRRWERVPSPPTTCARDDRAGSRDSHHRAGGSRGVVERLHDQLGEDSVERIGLEREGLGGADAYVSARHALAARRRVRLRGIHGAKALSSDDRGELGGQGTRSAADVEHAHPGGDGREPDERRRELRPVAAGVPVVRLSSAEGGHRGSRA